MHVTPNVIPKKKSGIFYGYWILLVCFLTQFFKDGSTFYAFGLYVKPLTNDFGWSRGIIMGASTVASLAMGLTSPLVGSLVYRYGAKKLIAAGAIIMGVTLALLSLIREAWQFYTLEVVLGAAFSAAGVIPCSIVVGNWFKRRRGFAIGVLGMGIGAGGFVMPRIIGMYLIPALGWRSAYLISGIITAAVITPLSLLIIRSKPEDMGLQPDGAESPDTSHNGGNKPASPEEGLSMAEARRTPAFWLMSLAFATFGFANSAIFQNEVPHLEDIGFASAVAAGAFSFVGIGSAVGKFGFGWLCDFIPAKFTMVIGILCQLFAVSTLMMVKTGSPEILLWLASLVFGLGVGCWLPALSMTINSIFGTLAYGTIFGMMSLVFLISGAAGPVVAGLIYDANKSYFPAFVLTLVLYIIAFPSILLVRRPKQHK